MTREGLLAIAAELLRDCCALQQSPDADTRLSQYGLSSRLAAGFVARLGERLGRSLPATLVWEQPTLNRIVAYLAGETRSAGPAGLRPLAEDDPVVIVGMACRLPGAADPERFWDLLSEAREAVGEVPAQRWDIERWYHPDPEAAGRMATRRGGFLDDVAGFDAAFFGISPREALAMDPQQRLVLELAIEALERAGVRPDSLAGSRTGVFMGAMWSEYGSLCGGSDAIGQYSATGRDLGVIANRISYVLGACGPSMSIDTACSASLVALHLALRSLRSGESRLALAGGVNLMLSPEGTVAMSKFGGMAPDGRSKAFDARADGYVRGEGAGIVLLMPRSEALARGLQPLAVVRGSATNNDGPSNGLTAPNPEAQVAVISDALADAGLGPGEIDYVEAHGTGTRLGDPIELGALGRVYGTAREAEALPVGSVKTNIGHLEAAAGIAGLIKAALVLERRWIPPTLHQQQPNPLIDFAGLRLRVPSQGEPLRERASSPPRAAVSSFGFGGSNAHALLEAMPRVEQLPRLPAGAGRPLVFVYAGNGGQWRGMARELLSLPAFVAGIAPLCEPVQRLAGFDLRAALADPDLPLAVEATVAAQLLNVALQVGLTRLLAEQGLRPAAVIGHSLGEIPAALAAGALDAEAAVAVVYQRSRLQAEAAGKGAMALLEMDWDTATAALQAHPEVVLAGENARGSVTLAGPPAAVAAACAALQAQAVACTPIAVDVAYHSPAMDPLQPRLVAGLAGLQPLPARIPIYSSVIGDRVEGTSLDAGYFGRNLRQPVRFAAAFAAAARDLPDALYLELGPHPLLLQGMRQDLERGRRGSAVLPSLRRGVPADDALRGALQALQQAGVAAADAPAERDTYVLLLSAHSPAALSALAASVAEMASVALPDLCRAAFERPTRAFRLALVGTDLEALRGELRDCRVDEAVDAGATLQLIFDGGLPNLQGLDHWRRADPQLDALARRIEHDLGVDFAAAATTAAARDSLSLAAGLLLGRLLAAWKLQAERRGEGPGVAVLAALEPGAVLPDQGREDGAGACLRARIGGHELRLGQQPLCQALCCFLAELWQAGAQLDWLAFDASHPRRRVLLPTTPFQRQRFWPEGAEALAPCFVLDWQAIDDSEPDLGMPAQLLATLPPAPPVASAELDRRAAWHAARALRQVPAAAGDSAERRRWRGALERLAETAPMHDGDVSNDPALGAETALIDRVGEALPALLEGRAEALALLFPEGDSSLLGRLYSEAPFARALGDWTGALGATLAQAGLRRVIEIGAGTGATTARLLPALSRDASYLFTDVSQAFLAAARQRFGAHPGLATALFDVEAGPETQGIAGDFDLAVAVNVLHATRDLTDTLVNVRACLREGGLLLLGEVTGSPGWLDLVFGSLPGWWRFEDALRPESALLDEAAWRTLLARCGFEAVALRGDGDRQSLILARAAAVQGRCLLLGPDDECAPLAEALQGRAACLAAQVLPADGQLSETWLLPAARSSAELADLIDSIAAQPRFGLLRVLRSDGNGDEDAVLAEAMALAYAASVLPVERFGGSARLQRPSLAAGLFGQRGGEQALRLGADGIRAQRLQPLAPPAQGAWPVRADASYLISGGLGALGLAFAEFLAARGARHLILLARSAPGQDAEAALARLRAAGVDLQLLQGDVADREWLQRQLADLRLPLAGIVHAAGVAAAELKQTLAPKLDGARALDATSRAHRLDFMLLFSSAAGIWGAPGQAAYAAANAALDAFAAARNAEGRRTLSLAFGRFDRPGLLDPQQAQRLAEIGLRGMRPEAAFASAWRLGASALSHVLIADIDWPLFRAAMEARGTRGLFQALPKGLMVAVHASRPTRPADVGTPPLASAIEIEACLRRLLAENLGQPDTAAIPARLGFFEQGLDSLSAVRLRRQLEQALARSLPPTVLFDHPSIESLLAYLAPQGTAEAAVAVAARAVDRSQRIAVIGIGCRFPGGIGDYDGFVQAVFDGLDAVGEVPAARWDWRELVASEAGLAATRWGAFLDDIELFDAAAFGIAPREALYMDPQQRLLLECAWRAAEHAGLDPQDLSGSRTGVFVGLTGFDYAERLRGAGREHLLAQAITGLPANTAAGRIAHTLGLGGPAMSIDTACSSSLVAVHLACRALADGDCELALAGGVNLILSPQTSIVLARAGMLSPRGRCRTFDADADGFVRAEGCGLLLLKPLAVAQADGDPVLAVIRASAINHDGHASGLTVPSGSAQQRLLRQALDAAGAAPGEVGYVELHGTGTALGDPIEAAALAAVYGEGRQQPLAVGSLKTNIGHAESASGVGGLIRAIAALERGMAPPNRHFQRLNPLIETAADQLQLAAEATPLQRDAPLAGVSGFGASGTNVHLLLEAGQARPQRRAAFPARVFQRRRFWPAVLEPVAVRRDPLYRLAFEADALPAAPVSGRWQVCGEGAEALAAAWRALGIDASADLGATAPSAILRLECDIESPHGAALAQRLQVLEAFVRQAPAPVFVLSRGALATGPEEHPGAAGSALLGLSRVLALACPPRWGGLLDLAPGVRPEDLARSAFALAGAETELALRDDQLRRPRLQRLQPAPTPPALDLQGSVLVTGAFGGIGEQFVRLLFARGLRHFALLGRHPDAARFAELEADGATLLMLAVDVADAAAMAQAARRIEVELPPVQTVLHLAGSREGELAALLATKLDGARHLDACSRGWPVRHFVLLGSAAAVWGDSELAGYAAANGALWGVAAARRAVGLSASVVAAGPVAGSGMLDAGNAPRFERIGLQPLSAERLLDACLRLGAAGIDATCADIDWPRFLAAHQSRRARPLLQGFAQGDTVSSGAAPAPVRLSRIELVALLRELIGELLGLDAAALDPERGFMALGLDSFGLMDLRRSLQQRLGQDLPAATLFEAASINRLAALLAGECGVATSEPLSAAGDGIAVIGVGLRLPGGADDLDSLAALLLSGRDAVGEPPAERHPDTLPSAAQARVAGWLQQVDHFDADGFHISPREAVQIDPQHRLLLEVAREALADAGCSEAELRGARVGVFVGLTGTEYVEILRRNGQLDAHAVGGRYLNAAAGRISHAFGWRGPSLAVDTACSSSASALHLALQALQRGDCELALAGGANLILSDETSAMLRAARMLSPSARCRSFDADADGYVRAEGVALVLLKPLQRARADGDRVLATILGSAMNHDGASGGYTVPNGAAQREAIHAALAAAGIASEQIGYVEAHGTGTALGDPIELHALAEVYASPQRRLLVGSIKSSIGHAEAAAGIAGLLKLIAAGRSGSLPATLHWRRPNPQAKVASGQVQVVQRAQPWPMLGGRRLAGLSSFGASGTNVHLIVEAGASEAPAPARVLGPTERPRLGLLFTGQGAQSPGMGAWLYRSEPVFAACIDRLAAAVDPLLPRPLAALLCDAAQALDDTALAQPALFAFELALAELWRSRGLQAGLVLGHSLGELAAAAYAGLLAPEQAAAFVVERGRLMSATAPGAMAAVAADEAEVAAVLGASLGQKVEIAARNGPRNLVLSGAPAALQAACQRLQQAEIASQPLAVARAFHSRLMAPVEAKLARAAADLQQRRADLPMYCNLDGVARTALPADYWQRQLRAPVAFAAALTAAAEDGCDLFLEVGPRGVLSALGRRLLPQARFIVSHEPAQPAQRLAEAEQALHQAGALPPLPAARAVRGQRYWPTAAAQPAADRRQRFAQGIESPAFSGVLALHDSHPQDWPELAGSGHFAHVGVHLDLLDPAPGQSAVVVSDMAFLRRLDLSRPCPLQRLIHPDGRVQLFAQSDEGDWQTVSEARFTRTPVTLLDWAHPDPVTPVDPQVFYAHLDALGLRLGAELRLIETLACDEAGALARLRSPGSGQPSALGLPAAVLEAMAQVAAARFTDAEGSVLVAGWERLERSAAPALAPFSVRVAGVSPTCCELLLSGADGQPLLRVSGLRLAPLAATPEATTERIWKGQLSWLAQAVAASPVAGMALRIEALGRHATALGASLRQHFDATSAAPLALLFAPEPDEEPACLAQAATLLCALPPSARVLLLTLAAVAPRPQLHPCSAAGASLRGLGRTLAHERADLDLRLVDIGPCCDALQVVRRELAAGDGEPAVAWRGGLRHVERLQALPELILAAPLALGPRAGGGTSLTPLDIPQPAPGEVLIDVHRAAFNFRDVLVARGLLEATPGLGAECVGRVLATGGEGTGLEPGDKVLAYVPDGAGALRSQLSLPARFLRRLPPGLCPARASAGLVSCMVARHALLELGGLRAGQRLLLHQAGSGVGLAALALARRSGAELLLSAHPDKHAFLRRLVQAPLFDSRSDLAAALQAAGGGLDLAMGAFGNQADAVRALLAAPHRLVDLGADAESGVDLDRLARDNPEVFAALFDASLVDLQAAELVLPMQSLPIGLADAGLAALGRGERIGRCGVVLAPAARLWRRVAISGAAGGVAREIAQLLAESGVPELLLLDLAAADQDWLDTLQSRGARVSWRALDVADAEAVRAVLEGFAPDAIVHAAAQLADAPLRELGAADFERVFRAKVEGARVLDAASRSAAVDAFILCSSVTALLPSAGQGAYAAANAALEQIAQVRRDAGYPASCLLWGPWSVGIGARLGSRAAAVWQRHGVRPLTPAQGREAFDAVAGLSLDTLLLDVDWQRYAQAGGESPLLSELLPAAAVRQPAQTPSCADAGGALEARVEALLARVLGRSPQAAIDPKRSFSELGLDSLLAGEFAAALSAEFAVRIPATLVYNHPTLSHVLEFLRHRLDSESDAPRQRLPTESRGDAAIDMDETDALDALERRLAEAERLLQEDP